MRANLVFNRTLVWTSEGAHLRSNVATSALPTSLERRILSQQAWSSS